MILAVGIIWALWSMREFTSMGEGKSIKSTRGDRKEVRLRGEVKLEEAGEIILPKGQKRV